MTTRPLYEGNTWLGARRPWTLLVLLVGLAGGCIGQEDIYSDIRAHRYQRFLEWQQAQAKKQSAESPLLRGPLDVAGALGLALRYNRDVQLILQEKEIASGRIVEAWSEALPKVDLSGTVTRLDKVGGFNVGGRKVSLGSRERYSLETTLTQPLYRGGSIWSGIRAARIYRYLADEQVSGVIQDVIFQVRRSYYDILLAQELEKSSQENLRVARRHLGDARKQKAAGAASEYAVIRAQVEVSSLEALHVERRNARKLAVTTLLKSMGVSQESDVRLTDALVYQPIDPQLAQAVEKAFRNHPDLLEAELNLRLQRESLTSARSGYWPSVDLRVTGKYTKPDPHSSTDLGWGHAWDTALAVTMPLFDAWRTTGRVIQEKAALEQRKIELSEKEEQILFEIKQALVSLTDARELIGSQEANVARAQEGYRLAEIGYRQGVNSELEVLDARRSRILAESTYSQAVHAYMMASLSLQAATGSLQPPQEGVEK